MKKFLLPAMGLAAAFGAAQTAAADVLLSQLFLPGQPGVTGTGNRTVAPGSPGVSPLNVPVGPSPFAVAPSPSATPLVPFIGQRGELNVAEPEWAGPGERDADGKIAPTADRTRARFIGERGQDGKLLPTVGAEQAQATPAPSEMQRSQPPTPPSQPGTTERRPGSGDTSGQQAQSGTSGTTDRSMQRGQSTRQKQMQREGQRSGAMDRTHREEVTTSALNALSAQGYSNVGRLERVGNMYQTTAMKDGRQVMVQVDPETGRVTER